MAKNKRQPYAVSEKAGEQTSAESWGTGSWNPNVKVRSCQSLTLLSKVAPSLVFLAYQVAAHTVLDKLHLAINVDLVACSHPQRSGGNGTRRSTLDRSMVGTRETLDHG